MECPNNDYRAAHRVYSMGKFGYCVKWKYKGYEISLAVDGQETFIFDSIGRDVWMRCGTGPEVVAKAVEWIDNNQKGNV